MGARRAVTAEIRRVVARLGGAPATHPVGPVVVAARRPPEPSPAVAALGTAIPAAVRAAAAPGAGTAALVVPAPAASARAAPVAVTATASSRAAGALRPRVHQVTARLGAAAGRLQAPPPATAARDVRVLVAVPRHAPARLPGPLARRRGPLPRRATVRSGRRGAAPLMSMRRRRAAWDGISRARLAVAWARILADHGLPADEVRLVGVYGPLPLGLVDAVAVDEAGRLRVTLRRRVTSGPIGDIAVARHEATGRLLRSAVPRAGNGRPVLH